MDIGFILNPNHAGEDLRDQVFVRHNKRDLGGYNTFVLQPEFERLSANDKIFEDIVDIFVRVASTPGERASLLSKASFSKYEYVRAMAEVSENIKIYSTDDLIVAWYWGGEGMLFFAQGDKAIINTDSRKESGWQWVAW